MSRIITLSILGALSLAGCEIEEATYDDTGSSEEEGGEEEGGEEEGGEEEGGEEGGDEGGDDDPDADGDGYKASEDCDDTNADINPGAKESCNSGDLNCDGVEPGSVTFTAEDGTQTDLTSTFSGTSDAPVAWTSTEAGELEFCSGTYYTHMSVQHDLEITTDAPWITTLDGGASGRVITSQTEGVAVSIDGVNVKNGSASYGAGISCSDGTFELSNLSVNDNEATGPSGGGIDAVDCDLSLNVVEVAYNKGDEGGGIAFKSSSTADDTYTLTIDTCDIRENEGRNAGGINISAYDGMPLVADLKNIGFYDNEATNVAGGLMVSGETTVTINSTDFFGNSAASYGGGLEINAYHDDRVNPTVDITTSNWGADGGSDDNSPEDLVLAGLGDASWVTKDMGDGVSSISCSENGCDITE